MSRHVRAGLQTVGSILGRWDHVERDLRATAWSTGSAAVLCGDELQFAAGQPAGQVTRPVGAPRSERVVDERSAVRSGRLRYPEATPSPATSSSPVTPPAPAGWSRPGRRHACWRSGGRSSPARPFHARQRGVARRLDSAVGVPEHPTAVEDLLGELAESSAPPLSALSARAGFRPVSMSVATCSAERGGR